LAHGPDDAGRVGKTAARGQGVQALLRAELPRHRMGAKRDAGDAPVPLSGAHGEIGVPGLVRAVERAEPEVDDADRLRIAVVVEAGDVWWKPMERLGSQPHR